MARVLIYNFSGELDEVSHLFPSERLARLAAVARAAGHEARVLDRATFADLTDWGPDYLRNLGELTFDETNALYEQGLEREAEALAERRPELLLANLWHGTGFKFTVDVLARLKRRLPGLRVYGVGQKVDWFKEHLLGLTGPSLDGLITGLGYDAVAALLADRPARELPGVILREGNGAASAAAAPLQVDDFPLPAYEPDVYPGLDDQVPVYSVALTNQACPNACAYCVRPANYGRVVRRRSMDSVVHEMAYAFSTRGATHFRIEDSTPPPGALTGLARGLLDSALAGRATLSGFARIDTNREEDFGLLRRAGVCSLFFGIESLDDEVLALLRKGFGFADVRATLERAHAAGLRTVGSFIFPTPGETRASMENTLRRLDKLRAWLDSVVVLPAGVYPPTARGRDPERFGIRLHPDYVRRAVVYPLRYLVPIKHWKPLPFSYNLLDRPADEVTFRDIVALQEGFLRKVREEYGIPGIPDYYFLLAHLLDGDPAAVAAQVVGLIMDRDYAGLGRLFRPDTPGAGNGRSAGS